MPIPLSTPHPTSHNTPKTLLFPPIGYYSIRFLWHHISCLTHVVLDACVAVTCCSLFSSERVQRHTSSLTSFSHLDLSSRGKTSCISMLLVHGTPYSPLPSSSPAKPFPILNPNIVPPLPDLQMCLSLFITTDSSSSSARLATSLALIGPRQPSCAC